MPFGILEQDGAGIQLPFPPRRDHLDLRFQRVIGELEPHLVVALAGGAVGHRIRAGLAGDLDLALGYERPRDRGAEQIDALIEGIGAEHRHHVVADEFLAQILDEDFLGAHHLGLGPCRLDLLALAEIGGERHDLAAIFLLQPAQDDRGVETSRIGQHHLLDRIFFRIRHSPLQPRPCPCRKTGDIRGLVGRGPAPPSPGRAKHARV